MSRPFELRIDRMDSMVVTELSWRLELIPAGAQTTWFLRIELYTELGT